MYTIAARRKHYKEDTFKLAATEFLYYMSMLSSCILFFLPSTQQ